MSNEPHQDHQTHSDTEASQERTLAADQLPTEASDAAAESAGSPESEVEVQSLAPNGAVSPAAVEPTEKVAAVPAAGPLSLERIRQLRKSQQKPPLQVRKPKAADSAEAKAGDASGTTEAASESKSPAGDKKRRKPGRAGMETGVIKTPTDSPVQRVEVPNRRQVLPELEDELSAVLGGSDLDSILIGDEMLQVGRTLTEGQRVQGRVMKIHAEDVFVALGGPDEGTVPLLQFEDPPEPGAAIEVIVRGFSNEEGLYELTLPGNAVDVSDWADIREGEVVEVLITSANAGGLECKLGAIRGFIPASQVAEYRVENLTEMVDQKVLCVVTEANERRGNLVLSRRAVLERERQEKRAQRLASIAVGDAVEGTVTKVLDFGAFVDIGGLDGLLHISQLSWERVNHPSEIVEVGQKIQVRIEKIDEQSGKIGLSYRSLQEHPWTNLEQRFPVGSIVKGTVTRIAEFGAFVKVATGVEGLVHVSELAHHRVNKASNVVQEGQDVDVKVLSIDEDNQRMSLSIKGAQAAPEPVEGASEAQAEEPRPEPALPKHRGPLKGGTGRSAGGEQFGLKW